MLVGKYEVWVATKRGSAIFSNHNNLEEAWLAVAGELDKLWLRVPTFRIKQPDGTWYDGIMPRMR